MALLRLRSVPLNKDSKVDKSKVAYSEEAIEHCVAIGLLEFRKMTEDQCRFCGFGKPGDFYLAVTKEFFDEDWGDGREYANDIAQAYLEKLTQQDRFKVNGANQNRRVQSEETRNLYRRAAAAIIKDNPRLAKNISAQARAVIRALELPETRFERVRKALSTP